MKVERLRAIPILWKFIENNLPPTLRAIRETDVEFYTHGIELRPLKPRFFAQRIAVVHNDEVEIFQPQYFSDVEKIVETYERMGGGEVKIKLWEKP